MINIVVTGCCGYIGSVLTNKLLTNKDYNVIGVDNLIYNNHASLLSWLDKPNFTFYQCDVNEIPHKPLASAAVLIHLAAVVGAGACDKDPERAKHTNVDGTAKIVADLNKHAKLIYLNTNSGYGVGGEGKCTEESPLNPVSLYGQTKVDAESLVLGRSNSTSLRLATVFGISPRPRMDLMVNSFVWKTQFTRELQIFEPHFRRNFVSIQDVCRAIFWCFNPALKGIFNVGLDEANMTKIELANYVNKLVGNNCKISIGEGKDPDKRDYVVSSDKIMTTGFKFQHSLQEGILQVARYNLIYGPDIIKCGNA